MSMGLGPDSGGDPWSWGVDETTSDSQQSSEWNNVWINQQDFSKPQPPNKESNNCFQNPKNQNSGNQSKMFYGNFVGNNNNTQGNQKSSHWPQQDSRYPPSNSLPFQPTTADYFNKHNNNALPEVENKEILPPDYQNRKASHYFNTDKEDSLQPTKALESGRHSANYRHSFYPEVPINDMALAPSQNFEHPSSRPDMVSQFPPQPHGRRPEDVVGSVAPPPSSYSSQPIEPSNQKSSYNVQGISESTAQKSSYNVQGISESTPQPTEASNPQPLSKHFYGQMQDESGTQLPAQLTRSEAQRLGGQRKSEENVHDFFNQQSGSVYPRSNTPQPPPTLPAKPFPPKQDFAVYSHDQDHKNIFQQDKSKPQAYHDHSENHPVNRSQQAQRTLFNQLQGSGADGEGFSNMTFTRSDMSQKQESLRLDSHNLKEFRQNETSDLPQRFDEAPQSLPPMGEREDILEGGQPMSLPPVQRPTSAGSARPRLGHSPVHRMSPPAESSRVPSHMRTPSDGQDQPGPRGRAPGAPSGPPSRPPDNTETLQPPTDISQQMRYLSISQEQSNDTVCQLDRNQYLETSQLSSQAQSLSNHDLHEGFGEGRREEREVPGEAVPVGNRIVVGQMTTSTPIQAGGPSPPSAPSPPPQPSPQPHTIIRQDESIIDRGSSLERMVVGERRDGSAEEGRGDDGRPPATRSTRQRNHRSNHHRESSFEEDDHDYLSDRDRDRDRSIRHPQDYRRDERHHRQKHLRNTSTDHGSSEYLSDEEFEYDRRAYRRERRGREASPEFRRDYYREDHSRRSGRSNRDYCARDYPEDYYYAGRERSRPSSRSGSDYRRAANISEFQPSRQARPFYYPPAHSMYGGGAYESNRDYYEMMRLTNPELYYIWYRDYMRKMGAGSSAGGAPAAASSGMQSYSQADRASVHSGQSGNRPSLTTPNVGTESNAGNNETFEDYTPVLFSTAHVRGNFESRGRILIVDAHYPMDSQPSSVQLCSVDSSFEQPKNIREFLDCTGPFIPGVTHRTTVLQYLKKMSEQAVKSSEQLLYDLVYLTVKSNGKPNMSDISELLIESYKRSRESSRDPWDQEASPPVSQAQMVSRFRDLLQQGNKTEALDWAMSSGGWGHALFLASKMDRRTHNSVMLQFANSLPANDPLQTLYQLMSGHVPQAATSCADRKWSDWRPHLAMMLSNPTEYTELDRKAVITLGDSLAMKGRLFAAHFCYLIAQVDFTEYSPDAKLVLLGASPNQPFDTFLNHKSFLLTLSYEYAIKQSVPSFSIPSLQSIKLVVGYQLVDLGRARSALQYCELCANEILAGAQPSSPSVLQLLVDLGSRLKMTDPQMALAANADEDPEWLARIKQLAATAQDLPEEIPAKEASHLPGPPLQVRVSDEVDAGPVGGGLMTGGGGMEQHNSLLTMASEQDQVPMYQPATAVHTTPLHQPPDPNPPLLQSHYPQHHHFNGYQPAEVEKIDNAGPRPSEWNEPEHKKPPMNFFQASEQQLQGGSVRPAAEASPPEKESLKEDSKKKAGDGGGGWFGGILDKFALRPKNQMVLPDDTDPKIVFDPKLKRWVDREGDERGKGDMKPPPMGPQALGSGPLPPGMTSAAVPPGPLPPGVVTPSAPGVPAPNSLPNAPGQTNKYKLKKGKSMKSNYVDVLGGNSRPSAVSGKDLEQLLPTMPTQPTSHQPNYFVPPPVESDNRQEFSRFGGTQHHPEDSSNVRDLSRSSSVSSLSREVQHYMAPRHNMRHNSRTILPPPISYQNAQPSVPMMYNPANFKS